MNYVNDVELWVKLSNRTVWGDGSGAGMKHRIITPIGKLWHKTNLKRNRTYLWATLTFHVLRKFRVVLTTNLGDFVPVYDHISDELSDGECAERIIWGGNYYSVRPDKSYISYKLYDNTSLEEFEELLVILKLSVL